MVLSVRVNIKKGNKMFLVLVYLVVIVIANLIITQLGPSATPYVAFVLVGLDISSRDVLHDRWKEKRLVKMIVLILSGSLISVIINYNALRIAIASGIAFLGAGLIDYLIYTLLHKYPFLLRSNGSNVFSAIVDSVLFIGIAFGLPLPLSIVFLQILAKIGGGFIWSLLLKTIQNPPEW